MNQLRSLAFQLLKLKQRPSAPYLPPFFTMSSDIANQTDRERLRNHFAVENTPNRWDDLWSTGTWLPWDRGTPNPALIDVLTTKSELLGSALVTDENGKTRRKRALVPGCGKGYDIFLFAAFGYDAYGLEGSKHAVEACERFRGEAEEKEEYKIRNEEAGRGEVKFVLGDFFSKEWEKESGEEQFDVIYDYTVSICNDCERAVANSNSVPLCPRAQIEARLVAAHARSPQPKR
jgi:methyl halide transferase